jgi:EAL domain-containing protein (putative c-di-GMP-specific phosphodiesterase class I)
LRHALERDEFVLHYQPVVDLRQRTLIGVEALIRWNDPLHGQLAPGEFIPLAEDTGAIVAIGHWVLQAAAVQVQAWNRQLARPLSVAVNISPRQFSNHNFLADLHLVLQSSGLAPSALHLEITETMVMQQHALSESILKRLGALGVSVAIDDFGTGYSSLSQLKSIPAQFIKIDRSFIMDCASDPQARAIVHAIIVMAHSLNLKVVAEGVEEAEQLRVLTEMGCDQAQGYFFGRPVDPQTMHAMAHGGDWLRERFECAVH